MWQQLGGIVVLGSAAWTAAGSNAEQPVRLGSPLPTSPTSAAVASPAGVALLKPESIDWNERLFRRAADAFSPVRPVADWNATTSALEPAVILEPVTDERTPGGRAGVAALEPAVILEPVTDGPSLAPAPSEPQASSSTPQGCPQPKWEPVHPPPTATSAAAEPLPLPRPLEATPPLPPAAEPLPPSPVPAPVCELPAKPSGDIEPPAPPCPPSPPKRRLLRPAAPPPTIPRWYGYGAAPPIRSSSMPAQPRSDAKSPPSSVKGDRSSGRDSER
ncbi:MAG: hypothetical protein RMJ52_16685 [Gemmataceae bacterium]|nr:hypothetical protein [Gemmataceae bacterium]